MKRISIFGEVLEAERIELKEDAIVGTISGKSVFRFEGIRDMSRVELLDDAVFDEAALTVEEEMAALKKVNASLQQRLDSSENAVLSLMEITMGGGM